MENSRAVVKSEPLLSSRRLGWAGLAGLVGCAACCAFSLAPLLGLASGSAAALSYLFRPGAELMAAGAALVVALGVILSVRSRAQRRLARLTGNGHATPAASCACLPTAPSASGCSFCMMVNKHGATGAAFGGADGAARPSPD